MKAEAELPSSCKLHKSRISTQHYIRQAIPDRNPKLAGKGFLEVAIFINILNDILFKIVIALRDHFYAFDIKNRYVFIDMAYRKEVRGI